MSTTPGCDYDVSTDYRRCADCGTKRPAPALVSDGNPDTLRVCVDRAWCRRALIQKAVEADRDAMWARGAAILPRFVEAVVEEHERMNRAARGQGLRLRWDSLREEWVPALAKRKRGRR